MCSCNMARSTQSASAPPSRALCTQIDLFFALRLKKAEGLVPCISAEMRARLEPSAGHIG